MTSGKPLRFELSWRERRVGGMETPRRFLDFLVDGVSLYERHGADYISCLGWFVPEEDERAARRLLREQPADVGDRTSIYVCPECGDLYCGVITANIVRDRQDIVWTNVAMSWFDHEADAWQHDTGSFGDWPELRFNAREYWSAISARPRVQ